MFEGGVMQGLRDQGQVVFQARGEGRMVLHANLRVWWFVVQGVTEGGSS